MPAIRILAAAAAMALSFTAPARAVVILESTFAEEGGTERNTVVGFRAHIALARQAQFRAVMGVARDGGDHWGSGTAVWIGNEAAAGWILTAAHLTEGRGPRDIRFRSAAGRVYTADLIVRHPSWRNTGTRTGFDVALVRVTRPITDVGPAPVLYAGASETGRTMTFVGWGARGTGLRGESAAFDYGDQAAAAQARVERIISSRGANADIGGYLAITFPREDGAVANDLGGPRRPISRLAGLPGAGDSGGPAFLNVNGTWVVAGITARVSGNSEYGEIAHFARVAGVSDWIRRTTQVARFLGSVEPTAAR